MLDLSDLFNEAFYLAQNPEVANLVGAGTTTAVDHFLEIGQFQGLNPSALFDTNYYLVNHPQVAELVSSGEITPIQHYINIGQFEGLDPSVIFDQDFYFAAYQDVAQAVTREPLTGIEHFVTYGQFEGRQPSEFFNESYYLDRNPDLAVMDDTTDTLPPVAHYLAIGAAEGREWTPLIPLAGTTLPNGVAAGDVTQTAAVLWTRTTVPGVVQFEYSTDPNLSSGTSVTTTALSPEVPVKVEIDNLVPGTPYFYRVTDGAGTSAVGQFRTTTPLGEQAGLRFGVSGDSQGHLTPYPALANVPDRNLDFFVVLGDTAYVDDTSPALPGVRQPSGLQGLRTKHNEVYAERFGVNSMADLRASTPVYVTWDDHEITNDFAGGAAPADSPQRDNIFGIESDGIRFTNDTPVFELALQAFRDYNPIRDDVYGSVGEERTDNELKLYRFNTFGNDAAMFLLDVRSFRDQPLPFLPETASEAEINEYLASAFEPGRTMLGQTQLAELKADLIAADQAGITWKFIMSSVPMQHFGIPVAGERWEGYGAERTDLLQFIESNNIDNVVWITGDFHGNVVNNVTDQTAFGAPQTPTSMWDIQIGPIAYQLNLGDGPFGAPFGPATVAFTPDALLPPAEKARYNALTDMAAQDAFVRQVIDNRLTILGYDPIGLEGSNIEAELLQGEYIAAHNFGWTEFEIDPNSQALLVTTYGIEPYSKPEIEGNPAEIISRTPSIMSQFRVNAT